MIESDQLARLVATVLHLCKESGVPADFDSRAWLDAWLLQELPALGFRRPVDVLQGHGGLERVQKVLATIGSGAYL